MSADRHTGGRTRVGLYTLPAREIVTRVRHVAEGGLESPISPRQTLPGFPDDYRDIVDFIVRITHRIWVDGDIGLIRETYDPDCVVYTASGVGRGVDGVVAGTIASMAALPEVEDHVLNVAWRESPQGFYTSHLGCGRVLNAGDSAYGAATHRTATVRYCADCVTEGGRIHTEWLTRDNGAVVRQLGLDLHDTARRVAVSLQSASAGRSKALPLRPPEDAETDLEGHLRRLFDRVWNRRDLNALTEAYSPEVEVHTVGGRVARGVPALRALHVALMASLPDGSLTVDNVCWSDETDGVIGAVRWTLTGTSRSGGWLGAVPTGAPVTIPGMTHCRFDSDGRIVEDWTVWDEVAVLARIYALAA